MKKYSHLLTYIIPILITLSNNIQAKENFFYHGYNYGSEAIVNPIRLILNGGYGIMQMDNRDNDPTNVHYKTGVKNVWRNLSNPFKAIDQEGWEEFLMTQVVPISINRHKAYYWPNYTQHLVGGGMSYRMMIEWFDYYNFRFPKVRAFFTLTYYHLLNEVVENSNYEGYNTDPIADIYIFNPLGMILFSNDAIARFFSHTLNMRDWSYQISYDPENRFIENNGQNFVMKYFFTKKKNIALFYHYGTHGEFGLSFKRPDGTCWSFGGGFVAKKLVDMSTRNDVRELTADLVPTAGIFYDKNNSLLTSLIYSNTQDYLLRLNIYPGLVNFWKLSPGFYMTLNQEKKPSFGINFVFLPIGFGRVL